MIELKSAVVSDEFDCPYISGMRARYEYFYACELSGEELDKYLSAGWRKFGFNFFRPACKNCRACQPLRIAVNDFQPSKSQRRVARANKATDFRACNLEFSEEIFEVYEKHSRVKFQQTCSREEFIEAHYMEAAPGFQTEFRRDGNLIAAGFVDMSSRGLSSAYFFYDTDFSKFSLGTLGILKEIELTIELGLQYYYLGYWMAENKSLAYKGNFYPQEIYNWQECIWEPLGEC